MSESAAIAMTLGILLLCTVGLVAYALTLRYRQRELQHREWLAGIEKGVALPQLSGHEVSMGASRVYLLRGLIWLVCGVTMTLLLVSLWLTTGEHQTVYEHARQEERLKELGYSREEIRGLLTPIGMRRGPGFPLGLSVAGLVPAGVGIAYLVFYRIETRRPR
jgi:hypothetical protein